MIIEVRDVAATHAVLGQIVSEFAWLSDQKLERISQGGVSGFIGPRLASAILEARRLGATAQNDSSSEICKTRAA